LDDRTSIAPNPLSGILDRYSTISYSGSIRETRMDSRFYARLADELHEIEAAGLMKPERVITSPQGGTVEIGGRRVLNLCANNYLGLASDPRVIEAAIEA